jgi:ankyrin repeat protein
MEMDSCVASPSILALQATSHTHNLTTTLSGTTRVFHHNDSVTMAPPFLALELLLMIADNIRDEHDELRYGDFNSFHQVNHTLYVSLNLKLWKEAAETELGTQRALTHFIKTNDAVGLEAFLTLGPNVEVRLPDFDTSHLDCHDQEVYMTALQGAHEWVYSDIEPIPLLIVADLDNVRLARLLLENGAEVQYIDEDDVSSLSPIHVARSAEMVHLLLEYNADPELSDDIDRLALHWYAIRSDVAAMEALLRHGADANSGHPVEEPLHKAAQRSLETVELLVKHGANVEARDFMSNTPLHLAAAAGKIDVVKFLVETWPEGMRAKEDGEHTPLHLAAMEAKTEVVKFLVETWPAGLKEKNDYLETPLHLAALIGKPEVANVNRPLHQPASAFRIEIVGLMVKAWPGAVREKNIAGDTPLHVAAMANDADVVRLLLENWPEGKAAVNDRGKTPLDLFCSAERARTGKQQISNEEKGGCFALLGGL